jgi:hypothetical protein
LTAAIDDAIVVRAFGTPFAHLSRHIQPADAGRGPEGRERWHRKRLKREE